MVQVFAPLLAFLLSLSAHAAAPAIESVAGASGYVLTGAVTIFGGLAGDACGMADLRLTCNNCAAPSCTDAPLCVCNANRVYQDLILRINVKAVTGDQLNVVAQTASATPSPLTPVNVLNPNFIELRWSDICLVTGGSCEAATNGTTIPIRIGYDKDKNGSFTTGDEAVEVQIKLLKPDQTSYGIIGTGTNSGEGITSFEPFPGDEKIYIDKPATHSNFPLLGYGTKAKAVRVYFSDTSLTNATPTGAEYPPVDIALTSTGDNLENNIVDGLENNKLYFFRVALLDEANNVIQFYPDPNQAPANDAACTSAPAASCPFAATPSEVLGLLSKDFNCFIATAAYGTTLEPKLNLFREFRHKILLHNPYGIKFVLWYYTYGPYAARYIHDKPILRAMTRGLLWPIYGFSYLALKMGFAAAFSFSLVLLTSLITLPWLGVRRIKRRE